MASKWNWGTWNYDEANSTWIFNSTPNGYYDDCLSDCPIGTRVENAEFNKIEGYELLQCTDGFEDIVIKDSHTAAMIAYTPNFLDALRAIIETDNGNHNADKSPIGLRIAPCLGCGKELTKGCYGEYYCGFDDCIYCIDEENFYTITGDPKSIENHNKNYGAIQKAKKLGKSIEDARKLLAEFDAEVKKAEE